MTETMEEDDYEWLEKSTKDMQKMAAEDAESFAGMDPGEAFLAALNYRGNGTILKHCQQREIIEHEWQLRVGTTFPGWEKSQLYAVAGSADIPAPQVESLSPYELYRQVMNVIAPPQQRADEFSNGCSSHKILDEETQQWPAGGFDTIGQRPSHRHQDRKGDHAGDSLTSPPGSVRDGNAGNAPTAVEALLGDEFKETLRIARSKMSADNKMREICRNDRRFLAWDSVKWASLLGVTDAAIRKTLFWRVDRLKAIEADRR